MLRATHHLVERHTCVVRAKFTMRRRPSRARPRMASNGLGAIHVLSFGVRGQGVEKGPVHLDPIDDQSPEASAFHERTYAVADTPPHHDPISRPRSRSSFTSQPQSDTSGGWVRLGRERSEGTAGSRARSHRIRSVDRSHHPNGQTNMQCSRAARSLDDASSCGVALAHGHSTGCPRTRRSPAERAVDRPAPTRRSPGPVGGTSSYAWQPRPRSFVCGRVT